MPCRAVPRRHGPGPSSARRGAGAAAAVVLGAPKPANPVAAGAAAVATGVMVRDGAAAAAVVVVAAPKLRPPPRVGAAAVEAEEGLRTFKLACKKKL